MLGYTSGQNPEPTHDIKETAETLKGKIGHAIGTAEARAKDDVGYPYTDSLRHPVDIRRDVLGRPIYEIPTTEDEYRRLGRKINDLETDVKRGSSYVTGKVEEAAATANQSMHQAAGKVHDIGHRAQREAKESFNYVEEKAKGVGESLSETAGLVKDKAKTVLEKTEQKAKDLGTSVKETVVATKDKLEDKAEVAGEKLKELTSVVAEKASHLKDSAVDSSIKLKDKSAEVAKVVTDETLYVSHVVGEKAKQGYEAVKEPIVDAYEQEKNEAWQTVSDLRDSAIIEKEFVESTQGSYKEQANELANKMYTEAKEKAIQVENQAEKLKDVAEEVAISTAHKIKDTADYTAAKAANVANKVVPPVKGAYNQTKETLYDKVKEARDKAADLKRQRDAEDALKRSGSYIDRMPDKSVHASEEFASPDSIDEVINNP